MSTRNVLGKWVVNPVEDCLLAGLPCLAYYGVSAEF
jgi:hypothetical protein